MTMIWKFNPLERKISKAMDYLNLEHDPNAYRGKDDIANMETPQILPGGICIYSREEIDQSYSRWYLRIELCIRDFMEDMIGRFPKLSPEQAAVLTWGMAHGVDNLSYNNRTIEFSLETPIGALKGPIRLEDLKGESWNMHYTHSTLGSSRWPEDTSIVGLGHSDYSIVLTKDSLTLQKTGSTY